MTDEAKKKPERLSRRKKKWVARHFNTTGVQPRNNREWRTKWSVFNWANHISPLDWGWPSFRTLPTRAERGLR